MEVVNIYMDKRLRRDSEPSTESKLKRIFIVFQLYHRSVWRLPLPLRRKPAAPRFFYEDDRLPLFDADLLVTGNIFSSQIDYGQIDPRQVDYDTSS